VEKELLMERFITFFDVEIGRLRGEALWAIMRRSDRKQTTT